LLNHAVFTEAEYKKGNSYLRLGVRLNYFGKSDKLLIEPRINPPTGIKAICIKTRREFKIKPPLKSSILKTIFSVLKKTLGASTMKIFLLQPASKALLG
jgi:hypothetical protein